MVKNSKEILKKIEDLKSHLISKIWSSDIFPDSAKPEIVKQINEELETCSSSSWFECKMILFKNRYESISKDQFFKWLETTKLRELIDTKGGFNG